MPEEADLVLAMSQQHAATLGRVFAGPSTKVRTLLGYAQGITTMEVIPDTYGRSIAVHRATVRRIFNHLRLVVESLGGAVGNTPSRGRTRAGPAR